MSTWYKSSDEWFSKNVKNKIHVFDDIIDIDYQNRIKHLLISGETSFPWYFTEDVTSAGDYQNQKRCAFCHEFVSPENLYVNLDLVNQKLQNFKNKVQNFISICFLLGVSVPSTSKINFLSTCEVVPVVTGRFCVCFITIFQTIV